MDLWKELFKIKKKNVKKRKKKSNALPFIMFLYEEKV